MLGGDEPDSTRCSVACSSHSGYTASVTMPFLERWLQSKYMDRKKLCLGLEHRLEHGLEHRLEHRLESAGANLKALTQPRCADDCGLE